MLAFHRFAGEKLPLLGLVNFKEKGLRLRSVLADFIISFHFYIYFFDFFYNTLDNLHHCLLSRVDVSSSKTLDVYLHLAVSSQSSYLTDPV